MNEMCNFSVSFTLDGDDRLMVGRVIMQADKVHGGVKSTTYLNHTIGEYPDYFISKYSYFVGIFLLRRYYSRC